MKLIIAALSFLVVAPAVAQDMFPPARPAEDSYRKRWFSISRERAPMRPPPTIERRPKWQAPEAKAKQETTPPKRVVRPATQQTPPRPPNPAPTLPAPAE